GRLFEKNKWLDVLVIQEINQVSLETFPSVIKESSLGMFLGPHMVSVGPKGGFGQHEYYPIVWNPKTLAFSGCWALHAGTWIPCAEKQDIYWTKPQHKAKNIAVRKFGSYRPVVVYRMITSTGSPVYICNLHTTPRGSGLVRKHEFRQVKF